ncbi:putative inorganic phosphate cotransporter isoform X2 [Argiope bruennichi]|uniref:putative inorganic phosphate cotransporter isoform X2 n=1 Tax=Argiope bruennichi TaxID=94029 RepID=UPI002493ED15|nr:putative inorganic phosphate cotransporter isoform X2 [Argiope bruennichi]
MLGNSNVEDGYSEKIPILGRERRQCCIDGQESFGIPDQRNTHCLSGCPKRWLLILLGFFGFVNVYAMRVNLSVAMVAMVRKQDRIDNANVGIACFELLKQGPNGTSSSSDSDGDFDWDPSTQSLILGSFFYGYVITQIPGGYFAEKYGAKWLYGIGVFITSVFTLLTPYAAFWGVWPLIIVRAIEGLGEGVTFPAMNALLGRWAPKNERSRMASIVYNGAAVGNVISFALSGIISDTLGWPSVFYIFGFLGIIWTFFWLFLVYETPELHPCITEEEIKYIRKGQDSSGVWKTPAVPWKAILTSRFLWALVITHFGQNWGFYTLLTELPTYLAKILHFDLKQNGMLSAIPYLMQACLAICASFIADRLRASGRYRINTIRKWFNSVAFFSPALCIALIPYVGCEPTVIIILLAISVGLNGFSHSGFNVTHVDMSPEFAGTLMGITNCIANLTGFLAPAYVGVIIQTGQTLNNWRIVFFTTSAVYVVSGLVYNIFCTAELQPWGTARPTGRKSVDELDDDIRTAIMDNPR